MLDDSLSAPCDVYSILITLSSECKSLPVSIKQFFVIAKEMLGFLLNRDRLEIPDHSKLSYYYYYYFYVMF